MIPRRWRPPLIWAALLLLATSWPNPSLPVAPDGTDKGVHGVLYLVLGVLVARAAELQRADWARALAYVAGLVVFGLLDELHQAWIPGRSADVADWIADGVGAALGVASYLIAAAPRRRGLVS